MRESKEEGAVNELINDVELGILSWEPMGTESLLEPVSSCY